VVDLDVFRQYTEWHDHANHRRYDAPADPWRLVPVDPAGVDRFTVVDLRYGLGQVRDGDWDRDPRDLMETRIAEGLVQRFAEGRDWADTVYHDYVREQFDSEHGFRGLDDFESDAPDWFDHVEGLYESIGDGYRTNRGNTYDDPANLAYVHQMDPIALVGRDGEIVWTEGFHRLVLARLAGVESVPVHVLWRHADWQATRDAVARGEAVDASLGHPDLRPLVA